MDHATASDHFAWTPQTAAYAGGALVLFLAGNLLQASYLVVLAGALVLALAIEAASTMAKVPRVDVDVHPNRIPEAGTTTVTVVADAVRADHQFHVPLGIGLRLHDHHTNLWHPRHGSTKHEHDFDVVGHVRGPHAVGPIQVRRWSPLRLWARDHDLGLEHQVEVVPRKEDVTKMAWASKVLKPMQGRFQVNRPGQGFDFFSLRGYQSGDTIRSVNWKATARKDDLIVNQRLLETHSEMLILLDARVTMGVGPVGQTPLDRGCRLALGIFADAVSQRDTVRFIAYGEGIVEPPPGHTERVTRLESLLARLPASGTGQSAEAWRQGRREMKASGPVVIVSSLEADSGMRQVVSDMIGRGHPVSVISPEPVDSQWLAVSESPRRSQRDQRIDELRNLGAIVVDWRRETPVSAERPTLRKAFA